MHVETSEFEAPIQDNDRRGASAGDQTEWVTPDFVEEAACAEICAYVFTA